MADYTIELRRYIESGSNGTTLTRREKMEAGRVKLFDFDYPFFDEDYRKTFETHFITHFYMREIGFETVGLFKMRLEDWLSLNMPYYNALFESEKVTYDPLTNAKMDVTHDKKNTQDTGSTLTGNSKASDTNHSAGTKKSNDYITEDNFNRDLSATTPDGRLQLTTEDGKGIIEYANTIDETVEKNGRASAATVTNATDQNSFTDTDSKMVSEGSQNADEIFTQHREGKIGVQTYAKMMMEYRKSLLRVEKECFDEMNELFMLVY